MKTFADQTERLRTTTGLSKWLHYQQFSASCLGCGTFQPFSLIAFWHTHFLHGLWEEPIRSHSLQEMTEILSFCNSLFLLSGVTHASTWTLAWTTVPNTFYQVLEHLLASYSVSILSNFWFTTPKMETNGPLLWNSSDQLDHAVWTFGKLKPQICHFITYWWWSTTMQFSSLKDLLIKLTGDQCLELETRLARPLGHQFASF